tara:strand:+ start:416 stop:769 length:354 start_codon:yes stop_codon:yes gene_type:complete
MYKLTGTIKVVKDTVQVTEKFSKREFVVNDQSSMYPQDIIFQASQDKCSMLDGYKEGDNVEVSFNIRGREWTSPQGEVKYFNTLDAWRIEKVNANDPHGNESKDEIVPQGDDDDLPF